MTTYLFGFLFKDKEVHKKKQKNKKDTQTRSKILNLIKSCILNHPHYQDLITFGCTRRSFIHKIQAIFHSVITHQQPKIQIRLKWLTTLLQKTNTDTFRQHQIFNKGWLLNCRTEYTVLTHCAFQHIIKETLVPRQSKDSSSATKNVIKKINLKL